MSAEALRRAVVEVVGNVCNGKARVLEEARSPNESRHRKVSFRRWCSGSKEPAHQCAWRDVEELGKLSDVSDSRRACEDRLEKLPTVRGSSWKVDSELAEDSTLSGIACVGHESTAELSPAGRKSNVHEPPDTAVPQGKHGVRRSQFKFAQQRNRWNAGKFAHQRGNSARVLARTRDRDEDSLNLARLQILDQVLDSFAVQGPVASFSRCIDTKPLLRSKERGDRWQLLVFLWSRRHGFTSEWRVKRRARAFDSCPF
jgi:hypothetical protein